VEVLTGAAADAGSIPAASISPSESGPRCARAMTIRSGSRPSSASEARRAGRARRLRHGYASARGVAAELFDRHRLC
jgi:hypothetical protein